MLGPAPIDDLRRDLALSFGHLVREVRLERRDSGIQNAPLLAIVTLAAAIVWAAAEALPRSGVTRANGARRLGIGKSTLCRYLPGSKAHLFVGPEWKVELA